MEHISKQEQRPKEGYLTKQSAIEAMHVMEYKYKEPFNVYICKTCGKYHIGRIRGEKMENKQATLETQDEETRPFYMCVKSSTATGFIKELNIAQEKGYRPMWDTRELKKDNTFNPPIVTRSVIAYDSEATGIDADETGKRLKIIDTVIDAEDYLYRKKSLLEDRENYLLLETNWDKVNSERKDLGLSKIGNEKQRTAFMNQDPDLKTLKEEVHTADEWLKLVKKYAELHELPNGVSPWEQKARGKEEQLQAMDEQASEVYVEKVGSEPMGGDVDG